MLPPMQGFISRLAGSSRVQDDSSNAVARADGAAASAATRRQDGTARAAGAAGQSTTLSTLPSHKAKGKTGGEVGQLRPQAKSLHPSMSLNSQASSTAMGAFFGLARLQSDLAKRFNSTSSKDSDKAMQKVCHVVCQVSFDQCQQCRLRHGHRFRECTC
jgi:hypothetical protein